MFFEKLFLTSITATKSIFYLVGFLAPWFFTKISSKKVNHKNARIFLPYVPPSLSSAAYLPLPLPTTTCRCLQLPANVYRYLFLSDHQLLPLWPSPANIYLSPDPFAQIASAEIIQQTRMPNNLNRLLLEDPFRQRISSIWFVF